MANDSSLGSAFDFDTQAGVMHLLASVRASDISASQKNELRDLVFLYSNGGHDQSVRNNLAQKLAQYAVAALPKPKSFSPPKVHEFGASRPAPAFATEASISHKPRPQPSLDREQEPASAVAAKSNPVSQATKSTPEEQTTKTAPAPAPTVQPEPVATAPDNLPHTNNPQPAVAQNTDKSQETAATKPNAHLQTDSLQRIKEIKALVNEKVGNPVNLVDIDNEVGREYMSALLDAMKKINSGATATSAMQRLESALVRVESAIEKHDTGDNATQANDSSASADEIETIKQPAEVPITTPSTPTPPAPEPVEVAPITPTVSQTTTKPAVTLPNDSAMPGPSPVLSTDNQRPPVTMEDRPIVPVAQSEKSVPLAEKPTLSTPATPPVAEAQPTPKPQSTEAQPKTNWGQEIEEPATKPASSQDQQRQVAAPLRYQPASLAQSETKLRSLTDLPSAESLETSSQAGDPLYTKQVDDGLNQLLSDWVLFKKSGLFGTGAKGIEHPLYLKIKDLQIPLLLAGRFEGATQEIKQSVTDYMNGWRYEQGIIYEQGEAFDHYLRRVIRHILDLQKKS